MEGRLGGWARRQESNREDWPVAHEVSRGPEGSWASVGASTVMAVCIFELIYVYYAVFLFLYIYLGKYLYIQFFC